MNPLNHPSLILMIILMLYQFSLKAQDKPTMETLLNKSTKAVRTSSQPNIDGRMDDKVWENAIPISDFIQYEPDNLAPITENTAVRILFDDEALYIGFKCFDSNPSEIMSRLARRDQWKEAASNNADWVSIALDPQNDKKTGYIFIVNAAGIKIDVFVPDDENYDQAWNAVWDAKVNLGSDGWTAEMKIPFSIFQFNSNSIQTWGMELRRGIYRKQEVQKWPGQARGVKGIVSLFGSLNGIINIPNPKQLELLPYVLGGQSIGNDRNTTKGVGVDMEYGISSNTSLSITINPDFGQVEADPSVLNLTAYETFYPEKRPFFVEGGSFFTPQWSETGDGWQRGSFTYKPIRVFHSRRIGKYPNYFTPNDGNIISLSENTTILGAAKVLGKTPSGINYGFIESITDNEIGIVEKEDGSRSEFLLEPRTNYFIGRIEAPFINNASILGITFTDVRRAKGENASVGVFDWRVRFLENRFSFNGQAAFSNLMGSQGGAGRFHVKYDNFKWWTMDLLSTFYDNGFKNNDLGFLRRSGVWSVRVGGSIRKQDPWGPFRKNMLMTRYFHYSRTDHIALARTLMLDSQNTLKSFWMFGFGGRIDLTAIDDDDLFKNTNAWMVGRPPSWGMWFYFSSDPRKPVVVNPAFAVGHTKTGGLSLWSSIRMTLNLKDNLSISIKNGFQRETDMEDYVDVLPRSDLPYSILETDYSRLYSSLNKNVRDLTVRINWTISPDLSLQLFTQPFYASNDYYDYKELENEGTLNFVPIDNIPFESDFRINNTVGTVVVRWEYSLGSTAYLVYNINDSNYYSSDEKKWTGSGTNTVFLKLNYWFQP